MRIDLHMHSHYSCDGEFSPTELAVMAKEKGLDMVALCDHDSFEGVKEMMEAGKNNGVKVIPAIELTAQINEDITHILGLNINPDSTRFSRHKENFENIERNSTSELIKMFQKEFDFAVDFDEMLERCNNAIYGLVPLVEELIRNPRYHKYDLVKPYLPGGERGDVALTNFYIDNCLKGGKFYIPLAIVSYQDIIEQIHQDGGIAIIAHPFNNFYQNYEYLDAMKKAGIDGIEAFSNYHNHEQNAWYYKYTKENGLLVSGGSDFHGAFKPTIQMGEFNCDIQNEALSDIVAVLTK